MGWKSLKKSCTDLPCSSHLELLLTHLTIHLGHVQQNFIDGLLGSIFQGVGARHGKAAILLGIQIPLQIDRCDLGLGVDQTAIGFFVGNYLGFHLSTAGRGVEQVGVVINQATQAEGGDRAQAHHRLHGSGKALTGNAPAGLGLGINAPHPEQGGHAQEQQGDRQPVKLKSAHGFQHSPIATDLAVKGIRSVAKL